MLAIAFVTIKEALRKKLLQLIGLLTLIYLALFSLFIHFGIKDMERFNANTFTAFVQASSMVSILGIYFSTMLVAFLTIMASIGAVSSEIENGTAHVIIARPLKRYEYVLGKYIGLAVLVAVYSVFIYISIFTVCRLMNLSSIKTLGVESILKGLMFFILEPVAILSLAIFGSVRFKTVNNGVFVISIYILGMIGSMMEQLGAVLKNDTLFKLGIFTTLISPFDLIYRKVLSATFSDVGVTNPVFGINYLSNTIPSVWMMLFIVLYTVGLPVLAVRRFNKRDI